MSYTRHITIESLTYARDRVSVRLDAPVIVAVSPAELDSERWGVFQFPIVWRAEERQTLQLQIHNGLDTKGRAGYQAAPFYYESADEGRSWQGIPEESADFTPTTIPLSPAAIRIGGVREDVHQAEGAAQTGATGEPLPTRKR